jgi:hypothetical protein
MNPPLMTCFSSRESHMDQLTKQDVGLLMEAMERWEIMPDIAFILSVANGNSAEAANRMQGIEIIERTKSLTEIEGGSPPPADGGEKTPAD